MCEKCGELKSYVFFFISFLSFHKINIKDVENKNDAGELLRYKVMDPLTLAS